MCVYRGGRSGVASLTSVPSSSFIRQRPPQNHALSHTRCLLSTNPSLRYVPAYVSYPTREIRKFVKSTTLTKLPMPPRIQPAHLGQNQTQNTSVPFKVSDETLPSNHFNTRFFFPLGQNNSEERQGVLLLLHS